jgi:hypothetical protein
MVLKGVQIKKVLASDARKYDLNIVSENAGYNFGDEKVDIDFSVLGKKDGGRIGYALGTPRDTTMFEELNADTIYRPETRQYNNFTKRNARW